MFTVTGMFEDVAYGVAIGPEAVDYRAWGMAAGTTRVLALLASREGTHVMVTPTGPSMLVKRDDPASLLGALIALTEVVDVTGEGIPDVIPSLGPDEVG